MTLGEYIKNRRTELGLSRNALGIKSNISHTEIYRIESNERKQPSFKVIGQLAQALAVPQEVLLKLAGYGQSDDTPLIERTFPGLRTDKQRETVERIADGLSRNSDLKDEDLNDLYKQVEMFIDYRKKNKDSL